MLENYLNMKDLLKVLIIPVSRAVFEILSNNCRSVPEDFSKYCRRILEVDATFSYSCPDPRAPPVRIDLQ